jgi:hypothetical protein
MFRRLVPTTRSSPLSETTNPPETEVETAVTVERRGHVLLMGLNRPAKRNALSDGLVLAIRDTFQNLPDTVRAAVLDGGCSPATGARALTPSSPLGASPAARWPSPPSTCSAWTARRHA